MRLKMHLLMILSVTFLLQSCRHPPIKQESAQFKREKQLIEEEKKRVEIEMQQTKRIEKFNALIEQGRILEQAEHFVAMQQELYKSGRTLEFLEQERALEKKRIELYRQLQNLRETKSSVPPTDEELISETRSKFGEGKIAFRVPDEMELNQTEFFEARLAAIQEKQEETELLRELKGRGNPTIVPLKISCRMRLTLSSEKEAFSISSITQNERFLDLQEPYASWTWDVTPQKIGLQHVHLIAEAIAVMPGVGEKPLYVKTFVYSVKVRVSKGSMFQWASRNWQYILGTIIIPLLGWLWSVYLKKKEEKSKQNPPDPPRIIVP